MKLSAALTVTALLCASTAFAQQDRTPPTNSPDAATQSPPAPPAGPASDQQNAALSQIFDQLNTSHTGKLTKEEAQAHPTVAANFDKADTNKDGVLTKDEFLAAFKTQQ
jgi:EF hand